MSIKGYIEANFVQLKGTIKETYGKLTDDDLTQAEGNYEKLLGKIQEAYHVSQNEAEKMLEKLKK